MIVLGVILIVVGWLTGLSVLWSIGLVVAVIGAILALVGSTGRPVAGRAHWF